MGDDLRLRTDGQTDVFVGQIIDEGATPGDVMTVQSDGSLAAEAGGSLPAPVLSSEGSPKGSTTATAVGQLCIDVSGGALYIALATGTAGWVLVGGFGDTTLPGVQEQSAAVNIGDGSGSSIGISGGDVLSSVAATGDIYGVASFIGIALEITDSGAATEIGFFGQTPAVQPVLTSLSTAAEIVAALQALGLSG